MTFTYRKTHYPSNTVNIGSIIKRLATVSSIDNSRVLAHMNSLQIATRHSFQHFRCYVDHFRFTTPAVYQHHALDHPGMTSLRSCPAHSTSKHLPHHPCIPSLQLTKDSRKMVKGKETDKGNFGKSNCSSTNLHSTVIVQPSTVDSEQ